MSYYRNEAHPHAPCHVIIIHNRHRVFFKHWLYSKTDVYPFIYRISVSENHFTFSLLIFFFLYLICENVQQNQFNCKLHCEYKTWLNFKKFTSQSANTDKIKLQLNRCFHKFNSVKYVNVRRKEHKETTITTRTKRNGMKEERKKSPRVKSIRAKKNEIISSRFV